MSVQYDLCSLFEGDSQNRPLLITKAISLRFCNLIKEFKEYFTTSDDFKYKLPLVQELFKLGHPMNSIKSIIMCRKVLGEMIADCSKEGKKVINSYWACNQRLCVYCSEKRKRRIKRKYRQFFKKLDITPKLKTRFLTLSPENYENFDDGVIDFKKKLNRFLKRKYLKDRMKGSIIVLEHKKVYEGDKIYDYEGNYKGLVQKDGFNIHAHILYYGQFLDNNIRGYCKSCKQNLIKKDSETGSYFCANRKCNKKIYKKDIKNFDSKLVREWKKSNSSPCHVYISEITNPKRCLNYVLGYVSLDKSNFRTVEDKARFIFSTRKRKFIMTRGIFFSSLYLKLNLPKYCKICRNVIIYYFDSLEIWRLKYQHLVEQNFLSSEKIGVKVVKIKDNKNYRYYQLMEWEKNL